MNNLSAWRSDDELVHIEDSLRSNEMVIEHTEEILALLAKNGLGAECWVYGSYCRPLHSSWFRVEGVTIIHHEHCQQPYSYAVMAARMARADVDGNELTLVSRPAR